MRYLTALAIGYFGIQFVVVCLIYVDFGLTDYRSRTTTTLRSSAHIPFYPRSTHEQKE